MEPEGCGCGDGCANGIAVTGTKQGYAGTLDVMLMPMDAGAYLLCVGGDVAATLDERRGVVTVVCAIDNLLEGASGQAVQALNIALGLEETSGLPLLPVPI